MKQKKLMLKKITISDLNRDEMKVVKGGFDLEDYVSFLRTCYCPPADGSENNC